MVQGADWTADDYDADLDVHTYSANTRSRIASGTRIAPEGQTIDIPVGVAEWLREWAKGN